jgi:FixJ family two-component response regulator
VSADNPIVFIIDDDPSICEALTRLFGAVGLKAQAFKTAQEFQRTKRPDCVLDVRLPGLSGLDLQRELANTDPPIPIVFITAHGDIPMTVQGHEGRSREISHEAVS